MQNFFAHFCTRKLFFYRNNFNSRDKKTKGLTGFSQRKSETGAAKQQALFSLMNPTNFKTKGLTGFDSGLKRYVSM